MGDSVTLEEAYAAAKQCGLNALSILKAEAGSLDNIKQLVRVEGFVCSTAGFTDQPKVINGASELFSEVLGDAGSHAQTWEARDAVSSEKAVVSKRRWNGRRQTRETVEMQSKVEGPEAVEGTKQKGRWQDAERTGAVARCFVARGEPVRNSRARFYARSARPGTRPTGPCRTRSTRRM